MKPFQLITWNIIFMLDIEAKKFGVGADSSFHVSVQNEVENPVILL